MASFVVRSVRFAKDEKWSDPHHLPRLLFDTLLPPCCPTALRGPCELRAMLLHRSRVPLLMCAARVVTLPPPLPPHTSDCRTDRRTQLERIRATTRRLVGGMRTARAHAAIWSAGARTHAQARELWRYKRRKARCEQRPEFRVCHVAGTRLYVRTV